MWAKRAFIITLVILWFVSVVIVPVFLSIYNFFSGFSVAPAPLTNVMHVHVTTLT